MYNKLLMMKFLFRIFSPYLKKLCHLFICMYGDDIYPELNAITPN